MVPHNSIMSSGNNALVRLFGTAKLPTFVKEKVRTTAVGFFFLFETSREGEVGGGRTHLLLAF